MVQQYALMECERTDEVMRPSYRLLNIITDDDGKILEMTFPRYRSSDATAQSVFNQWRSSEGQTLADFYQLIEDQGEACLQVVSLGIA